MFSDLQGQKGIVGRPFLAARAWRRRRKSPPYNFLARGRLTNSPPQFGQTHFICRAQSSQNVHSKVQMYASPAGGSFFPHFSHSVFMASDIAKILARAIFMREHPGWHAKK
jgi:hypothetical protein